MAYMAGTYDDIRRPIEDWLRGNGSQVSNVALSIINRAKDWLWQYRPWDGLVKIQRLVVDGQAAAIPESCGRILAIYDASDVLDRPSKYYFSDEYSISSSFSVETGHAKTINFYFAPSSPPIIKYQALLPDFTGTGTEYSFFPVELMIRQAQLIRLADHGVASPNELIEIRNQRDELLRDYQHSQQHQNAPMRRRVSRAVIDTLPFYTFDGEDSDASANICSHSPSADR